MAGQGQTFSRFTKGALQALPATPVGRLFWAITVLGAIFVAFFDPFSLNARSEAAAEGITQYLFSARSHAFANSHIAIIEGTIESFDDEDLAQSEALSFEAQAQLVAIATEAHVRGIFIDADFKRNISGEDLNALAQLVEAIKTANSEGIPVLTGSIGRQLAYADLRSTTTQTTVGWQSEHPADYALAATDQYGLVSDTPAAALYKLICSASIRMSGCSQSLVVELAGRDVPPIALQFGNDYPEGQQLFSPPDEVMRCRSSGLADRLKAELWKGDRRLPCPRQLTIPANVLLMSGGHPAIQNALRDRIVMIGVGPELGDDHLIPGIGLMPGVFLHATALENLLLYRNHYPRWPPDYIGHVGADELLKLATIILLPLLLTGFAVSRMPSRLTAAGRLRAAWQMALIFTISICTMVLGAVIGWFFADWPISTAVSIALLSGVVAQVMSGEAFRRVLTPLTNGQSASLILLGIMVIMLALVFPWQWTASAIVLAGFGASIAQRLIRRRATRATSREIK